MSNKLNAKDLINVGIFTAIYFVVFFACGMLGYIPIFMIGLPLMIAIVGGIPFMLYLTKVRKFGMVTITGIIIAILMFATGHGWPLLIIGSVTGFLADLIFKSGQYKSWKKTVAGYCVFSLWSFGAMIPMWVMRDSYFESIRSSMGDEYTNALMSLMSGWMLLILVASTVIGAIIGAYLGRATLKKHFKRAGIA
jgi:energy-coupling factor transport system substrate-specific component